MNEACEAAGVKLSLAKISRWLEAVKVGHDLVADGAAGDLVALHVHRLFPGYPNTGWPLDPREGGAWLDWGSHGCDIVRWYAGREPTHVAARFVSRRTDMPDLTGMATFEFPGALLANLFMSYEIPGSAATERAHYTAIGTEAVIDIHAYGAVDLLRGDMRERGLPRRAVHRREHDLGRARAVLPARLRGAGRGPRRGHRGRPAADHRRPRRAGRGGHGDGRAPLVARGRRRPAVRAVAPDS